MKQKAFMIGAMVILSWVSACSMKPSSNPIEISQESTVPVITEKSSTPEAAPSPALPTPTSGNRPSDTPTPEGILRIDFTQPILCPTKNKAAMEAYTEANDLRDRGELPEAEQSFLKAIELDPLFCDAMDNLGQLLRQQGRFDEAVDWYLKSLDILPENTVAWQNLAVAYNFQGEIQKSIEAYEKLIVLAPENPEGYFGLGTIYYDLAEIEKAIEYIAVAEELYTQQNSPYLSDARYYLGLAHFRLENCADAMKYMDSIYDQFPDDGGVNFVLGMCYLTEEPVNVKLARDYILKAQQAGVEIPADVLIAIIE